MKKTCLFACSLLLAVMIGGCKSAPASAGSGPTVTPDWINELPPDDALWGIGTARQSSPSMTMTTAEARARMSIARQLQTKAQGMFTDYNLDAGNAGSQANASLQENVSRQLTNVDLSGARPIKKWQAKDGAWWYLVEMKKSDAKAAVAGILGNEEAAFAQFKAQQALQMMDAQLAKNEKPLVVGE